MIDKAQFFAECKLKSGTVEIDGLGPVDVRELSSAERESVFSMINESKSHVRAEALTAAYGCRILDESDVDSIMSGISHDVIEKLAQSIMALSGMGGDDVEEAEKN